MKDAPTIIGGGRARKVGGWKPEPEERRDPRDRYLVARPRARQPETDTNMQLFAVFDQLDVGSCVMNAIALAFSFAAWRATGKVEIFSRLFGYAMGRFLENTPLDDDSGLFIPDGFRAVRRFGLCYEETWAYGHGHDRYSIPPSKEAITEALRHQGFFFYRCPTVESIRDSIEQGWPVVFGTAVPTDLDDDGEFRLPGPGAGFDGGHAMLIKGYSATKMLKDGTVGAFRIRNSWGEGWRAPDCEAGEGWIAEAMFRDGYARDAVTLRGVELDGEFIA